MWGGKLYQKRGGRGRKAQNLYIITYGPTKSPMSGVTFHSSSHLPKEFFQGRGKTLIYFSGGGRGGGSETSKRI